jgi:hypothetical protein
MIPQGPIYSHIRGDVLSTYPEGTRAACRSRTTFAEWLLNGMGSYHVKTVTSNDIIIVATPSDLASSLLADVEFLSNHCFEHLQELARYYVDDQTRSDAWNVVTIYYFAFFSAQIFLRLIGSPTVYVGKEQIQKIKSLAGVTTGGPGAGSYFLEKITDVSASYSEYKIKKTGNQRIHEATWIRLFSYFERLLRNSALSGDVKEVLFYQLLTTKTLHRHYTNGWPSVIRGIANYRAGFAYLEVEKNLKAKTKKLLTYWKDMDTSKLLNTLNSSVSSCSPSDITDYSNHVRLLHDMAQSLFILTRLLYSELLSRSNIDKTWEHKRSRFRKIMSISLEEFSAIACTFTK